jgi:putative membrane protein
VRGIIIKIIVNAVAIWVATVIVPGVSINASDTRHTVLSLVVVGALFGIVNTLIKPVVAFLALPFYILTLGLIAFVVNALMLKLADWLSGGFGISFNSGHFFWSTIGAAVVVSLVSLVLNAVVRDKD